MKRTLHIRLFIALVTLPVLGWFIFTHNPQTQPVALSSQTLPCITVMDQTNLTLRIEVNGMLLTSRGMWEYRASAGAGNRPVDIPAYYLKTGSNTLSVTWSAIDASMPSHLILDFERHDAQSKDGLIHVFQVTDPGGPSDPQPSIKHTLRMFKIDEIVPHWSWVTGEQIADTAQLRASLRSAYVAFRDQAQELHAHATQVNSTSPSAGGLPAHPGAALSVVAQSADIDSDLFKGVDQASVNDQRYFLQTCKVSSGEFDPIPDEPLFDIMAGGTLARLHGYGERSLLVFRGDAPARPGATPGPFEIVFDPWFRLIGGKWVLAAVWWDDGVLPGAP